MSNPRVCYDCKTKTANGRETQVKRNNSATRGQKSVAAGVAGDLLFGGSKRTKSAWKSKNAVSRAGGTHKTVWMCNSCLGESSSAASSAAKSTAPKVEETQDKPFQTFRESFEEGKRQGEERVKAFEEKCKAFEEKCNNFSAKCDELVSNANTKRLTKRLNKAAALATMYVMYTLTWIIALGGVLGILQGELPLSDVPSFVVVGGMLYGIGRLCKRHSR